MIMVMSDVLPLAEVKAKFSEMVDRVEQQHDRITVTRNGRPAAVLMSADDLAALEDTLELLSDPTRFAPSTSNDDRTPLGVACRGLGRTTTLPPSRASRCRRRGVHGRPLV
jgi:antitoxin YefM